MNPAIQTGISIVTAILYIANLSIWAAPSQMPDLSTGNPRLNALKFAIEAKVKPYENHIGLSVYDMTTKSGFSIQGNTRFNPASTIKVAIAAVLYHEIAKGKLSMSRTLTFEKQHKVPGAGTLQYKPVGTSFTVQALIEEMLTHSDNTATKLLADHIGITQLNTQFQIWGLHNTQITNTHLLNADQNHTTPNDMKEFLTKLNAGELIPARYSGRLLRILATQNYRWGIPKYLPTDSFVANKTGTLKKVRNDIAVVKTNTAHYILSIYTSGITNDQTAKNLIASVSKTVYDALSTSPDTLNRSSRNSAHRSAPNKKTI